VSARHRAGKRAELRSELTSDGTLAGTRVSLNGVEIRNLAAVDLHVGADGATLHVSVGQSVIDYGAPARVDVAGVSADVRPSPTPRVSD
jgi:hypothetical protein